MNLEQSQWCHLTVVQKSGTTLLQEILAPFKTNPNIDIQQQMETHSIRIHGAPEAVISAYDHITNQLKKDLHMQDRYDITMFDYTLDFV